MLNFAGKWILGNGLYQGSGFFAVNIKGDNGVNTFFANNGEETKIVNGNVDRVGTVSVNNGGNVTSATGTAGSTFTKFSTSGCGKSSQCYGYSSL